VTSGVGVRVGVGVGVGGGSGKVLMLLSLVVFYIGATRGQMHRFAILSVTVPAQ
jgi:hypothetical protein